MKVAPHLMFLLPIWLLTHAQGVSAQAPPTALSFGVPIERDVRSGEVHEYRVSVAAGDLVFGTIQLRTVEALVEVVDSANDVLESAYPVPQNPVRIGFTAPQAGTYRVRIKAFDRFDGGPQWAPGALLPVVGTAAGSYTLQLNDAPITTRMRGAQPETREEHRSTRLARLTRDLQAGQRDALGSFWREAAGRGPLVEEIPGNDREVDVTFLWREVYDTRNVLLIWCPRTQDCYMSHLPDTDVWYKTLRLRRGTRMAYDISPNDSEGERWATTQLDPLNPRRTPDDPTYPFQRSSVLDLTGAPDEQWALRRPARRGLIEERTVTSMLLSNPRFGGKRPIWVYTPPGYTPSAGPYPLLVLLDGAAYISTRFGNAPATLDNLINDGRIRPTIVVFDAGNRGGGPAGRATFGEALVKELLPMLRASYPITASPADTVIGGSSGGGLAAAEIALAHSEVFGNVLSQSGAFRAANPGADEPNSTAQTYLAASHRPIRFYLEVGLYDNVPGANLPVHDLVLDETNLMGNRHLRDVLRAKGYDVTYREVGGGHEWVHWRAMLAEGLMTLLGR